MLPLAGVGGVPIKMPAPELTHSPEKGNSLKINEFRANQFKETLSTRFNESVFARNKPALSAKPRALATTADMHSAAMSAKPPTGNFLDVPIVARTLRQDQQKEQTSAQIERLTSQQKAAPVEHRQLNHTTSMTSNWRALSSTTPRERASQIQAKESSSVFEPPGMVSAPVQEMTRIFRNYDSFRRDVSPGLSKADYQKFLGKMVQEKNMHDSNMNHTLDVQRKIVAFRQKEQHTRAHTLCVNVDQERAQKCTSDLIRN